MTRAIFIATAALATLLALAVTATAGAVRPVPAYSFTVIGDTADGFSSFGCPALNDAGTAAFGASTFDPETFESSDSLQRGSGGRLTTIADEGDDFSFFGNPSINKRGAVSVAARFDEADGEAIVRGRGGPLTRIARTDPGRFNLFTRPRLGPRRGHPHRRPAVRLARDRADGVPGGAQQLRGDRLPRAAAGRPRGDRTGQPAMTGCRRG